MGDASMGVFEVANAFRTVKRNHLTQSQAFRHCMLKISAFKDVRFSLRCPLFGISSTFERRRDLRITFDADFNAPRVGAGLRWTWFYYSHAKAHFGKLAE